MTAPTSANFLLFAAYSWRFSTRTFDSGMAGSGCADRSAWKRKRPASECWTGLVMAPVRIDYSRSRLLNSQLSERLFHGQGMEDMDQIAAIAFEPHFLRRSVVGHGHRRLERGQ